jgi:Flp pilus assembly CpaF family ATPase
MGTVSFKSEAVSRGARMLRTALGPAIAGWLEDPTVVEVMLNPDGRLWIDRLTEGLADTGKRLSAPDGERIVRLVAHHVGAEVHPASPRVSAELPETGERFEGLIPPVVAAPVFAIRKPAVAIFTLDDYAAAGIMTADQATVLRGARAVFLAAYSPDLNPIEQLFARLKSFLRKTKARTVEELWRAIASFLKRVSKEECKAYLANSGYT